MFLPRTLVASVVAAAMSLASASAQAPASQDLVGTWNLNLTSPQGTHPATFTIKEDAGQLTGSVSGEMGTTPVVVKTSDAGVTLAFTVDYQGQPLPILLTGKLADGALKGTVDYGNGSAMGDFEGRKGAAAAGAETVTGTWAITSDGGPGWSMALTQEGTGVTGTLRNAESGMSFALKGTLTGAALDLVVSGEAAGTIKGTLDGGALKGSYEVGGSAGAWSATRNP